MIDLHSHTWYSDGQLAPGELIMRAAALGITHLAITDHDSVAAHRHAGALDIPGSLSLISGVEISTLWENREVHMVGLFIDIDCPTLNALLTQQQQIRRERASGIARQLERAGITGLTAYLQTLPCESISRNHIADFLIANRYASSKQQAFSKHLGQRGRFHQAADWCEIATAAAAIKSAGGVAVLAHPDRYKLNKIKLRRLLTEFSDSGGEAVEVSYSNLNPVTMQQLAELCISLDLWASLGSDFHTPDNTWMDLGKVRRLPAQCESRAIWHHPRWPQFPSLQ
jgi:3',5'-nucleoside bisphosphate phosphatase